MKYCGFDVARMGKDYSVLINITYDEVVTVRQIDFFSKIELMELCGWAVQLFKKLSPDKIMVDAIGVGAGVFDRLNEQGLPVVAVNVAESPCHKQEDYKNKKSEMYWNLRQLFEKENIKIPPIPNANKLMAELSQMKYKYDSSGKLQIVDPEKSPDFADALALACYGPIISAQRLGAAVIDLW
jgi:phage terminase large subunit